MKIRYFGKEMNMTMMKRSLNENYHSCQESKKAHLSNLWKRVYRHAKTKNMQSRVPERIPEAKTARKIFKSKEERESHRRQTGEMKILRRSIQ